ncbi:MAG: VOC family protein [Planctomycetales bacterium]|nr:VOC family protein [Planctomycetales bacterium]
MNEHERINYVEFPARDMEASKAFLSECFGWKFTDYGPDYMAFTDSGLEGGFFKSDKSSSVESGSALIVLYSKDLEATLDKIVQLGGTIVKPIVSFPGGRRFHFCEPSGNELSVWSDL